VALDPGFVQAWSKVSRTNSLLYANSRPTPALAQRARQAAEKAVQLAPSRPEGFLALGSYERFVSRNFARALEQYTNVQRIGPGDADLLRGMAAAEAALGRWDAGVEHLKQAERLDPRSVASPSNLGTVLLRLRRYPEAREAFDRALALAPANLTLIEYKVLTFLAEGDLAGARVVLKAVPKEVEPTALVAYFGDLVWVFEEQQQELLLRLTPSAFDDDRGAWGICLAQAYALKGDTENVRTHARAARQAFEEQLLGSPDNADLHIALGLALAYLGRKEDAIREGERGVALHPVSKDALYGPDVQHDLVQIYMATGEPEKALDQLEPLLKIPYYLSPEWLKIDPTFAPLRGHPRFEKLTKGTS
jgi:tetratricopeptide (TPR) repeat protein